MRKPDKKKRSFSVVIEYSDGSRESVEVPARDYASALGKIERDSSKKPLSIKLKPSKQPESSKLTYIC